MQSLEDTGFLVIDQKDNNFVVERVYDPAQDFRNTKKVVDAIEVAIIGKPLEYDVNTLYKAIDNNKFDQTLFNQVITSLRINGAILDEDGKLYHKFDSITVTDDSQ